VKFTARPYQLGAKKAVIDGLNRGKNPCISLATGLGKTIISKMVVDHVRKKGHKILFLVNQINLAEQCCETLGTQNIHGEGKKADWSESLIIGVIQTIKNDPTLPEKSGVTLMIVDEFHRSHSDMYMRVFRESNAKRVGLSATVLRGDRKSLGDLFDEVVFDMNIHEGIDGGWLCQYEIMRPSNIGDMPFTYISYIRDGEEMTRRNYNNPQRNLITVSMIEELVETHHRRHIIIFCNTIEHAVELKSMLGESFGVAYAKERKDLKRFRKGELVGICSVQLLLEGFDYPPTDAIVVAGTISRDTGIVRATQLIGRGLRPSEGKDKCIILDLSEHGIPDPLLAPSLQGEDQPEQTDFEPEEPEKDEIIDIFVDTTHIDSSNFVQALRIARCAILDGRQLFGGDLDIIMVKPHQWQFLGTNFRFKDSAKGFQLICGEYSEMFESFDSMENEVKNRTNIEYHRNVSPYKEPTDAQRRALKASGLDVSAMTRKDASEAISLIKARKNAEPATGKQKWKLRELGVEYRYDITKTEAGRIIGQNVA